MSFTSDEIKTIASYDDTAKKWAGHHSTPGWWNNEIAEFKKYLPNGKIIEVGSGGGRDAKDLINAGYDYIGTDVSKGLLNVARENNPGVIFVKSSVYDLAYPNNSFDGFWASAVLLHIPKDRINEALVRLHSIVKSGGIGFISVKQGKGQKLEAEDAQIGKMHERLFSYYSLNEFSDILINNNFEILNSFVKPTEGKTVWLVFFVKVKK